MYYGLLPVVLTHLQEGFEIPAETEEEVPEEETF